MNSIPVDLLQNKTRTGLQIKTFQPGDAGHAIKEAAHRNDHYIFFLLTGGSGTLKVDLEDVCVTAGQIFYILPSQVHSRIKAHHAAGWFLAIDTSLISPEWRGGV